jgi:hypothetical protein
MSTKKGLSPSRPDSDLQKFTAIGSKNESDRITALKELISEQVAFVTADLQRSLDKVHEISALVDPNQREHEMCSLYLALWAKNGFGRSRIAN